MNKRAVGGYYEGIACMYLESQGVRVTEKNFRCRNGEIDIVAADGEYLVFVEVKHRTSASHGYAEESVTFRKQNTICRVADFYMTKNAVPRSKSVRFDVIAVSSGPHGEAEINWIKNAFPYHARR